MIKYSGDLRRDFDKATAEISKLNDRILGYQEQIAGLRETEKRLRKNNAAQKKKYEDVPAGLIQLMRFSAHKISKDKVEYKAIEQCLNPALFIVA